MIYYLSIRGVQTNKQIDQKLHQQQSNLCSRSRFLLWTDYLYAPQNHTVKS